MIKYFICLSLLIVLSLNAKSANKSKSIDNAYVVLLHGVTINSTYMEAMAAELTNQGYDVINLDYPSTDFPLEELAKITSEKLKEKLIDDKPVNFVGYSMGGVLTRIILNKYRPENLHRVVQLATPNNGMVLVDRLKDRDFFKKRYGPAGQQLSTTRSDFLKDLIGSVDYELGVIAGNKASNFITAWMIPEENDGKVSVESTKIDGMNDHVILPISHSKFLEDNEVLKQTIYFLQDGKFIKN